MKHIFIINPVAGKGNEWRRILNEINNAHSSGTDCEIYETTAPNDATRFVRERIKNKPDGKIYRFYACGGDGTLSEVVSGAARAKEVEIGCIPIGTGNDFVRNFTNPKAFFDLTRQLNGRAFPIDCYSYGDNGYGVNMINIGFDCDVAAKASELKRGRLMPKALAYITGVVVLLRENKGCTIRVIREDGSERVGEFQLVSAANGGFCGGGFHSAPKSSLSDGLLDVSLISKVTRLELFRLIGAYKGGKHLATKLGKRVVEYSHAKTVEFEFTAPTNVCIDGEISKMERIALTVVPDAVNFVVPDGSKVK